ncbi:MAG: hypothetical protein M0008_08630 [Actinomycetota bacterium]|nr:hypothetical protein [Actinomycetota bacterium]
MSHVSLTDRGQPTRLRTWSRLQPVRSPEQKVLRAEAGTKRRAPAPFTSVDSMFPMSCEAADAPEFVTPVIAEVAGAIEVV